MRVPYASELEKQFRNPKEFLDFCQKMRLEVYFEDSLQPATETSWYQWSSRKENLIVVPRQEVLLLVNRGVGQISVVNTPHKRGVCEFFEDKSLKSRAIVFDKDIAKVKKLFSEGDGKSKGLKVEQSSWKLVEFDGKLYILDNQNIESALIQADIKNLKSSPLFRTEETLIPPKEETEKRGRCYSDYESIQ